MAVLSCTLQTQFYIVVFNTCVVLYNVRHGVCQFPEWMGWGLLLYCFSMITLFSAFYVRAYKRGERAPVLPQSAAPAKQ